MSLFLRRAATVLSSRPSLTSNTTPASKPFSTTRTSCSDSNENNNSAIPAKDNVRDSVVKGPGEAEQPPQKPKKKTMAELDEELRLKLEGMSGGGGSAGVEYENGKAEGLRRGVKDNMFRVI